MISTASIIVLSLCGVVAMLAIGIGLAIRVDRRKPEPVDLYESDYLGDSFAPDPEEAVRAFHRERF